MPFGQQLDDHARIAMSAGGQNIGVVGELHDVELAPSAAPRHTITGRRLPIVTARATQPGLQGALMTEENRFDREEREFRKTPKSTRTALVIASIIAALWAFASVIRELADPASRSTSGDVITRIASDVGYGIGASVFSALIVWLVLYFAVVRKRAPERGGKHFLTVLASAMSGGVLPLLLVAAIALSVPRSAVADRLADEYLQERQVAEQKLEADQAEVIGAGVIDPARIGRPGGIDDARARLEQVRVLMVEAMAEEDARVARYRQRLLTEEKNGHARRIALADLDEGFAANVNQRAGLVRQMDALNAEISAQIDLLERTRGSWSVQRGSIMFDHERDLETYRAHDDNIQRIMNPPPPPASPVPPSSQP